ncbi:hypothetical protein [Candidatus Venteria ishoeyi]|uniref:Uncharacterized protein n=1 Tax=Candidatus Venteria ishoeyi TaxID=1899563 RepID=A0A1H6F4T4_9GAMM|nr:hypothetical protein [Candidatus Venteria ishoeyi]SEH05178.1 Uncharacterised protein [Candidatus Venteria ishoeyi]
MPTPRKEQVSKHINGHYHCISRAVRRTFLCGVDKQSGCNYEHRRQWILDRLEVLAGQFAVEVCAYAIIAKIKTAIKIYQNLIISVTLS